MTVPKLSANDTKVLQALRAGPMESLELYERFTGGYAMKSVLANGYVQFEGGVYKITELGRQVCPTRREIEKARNLPPLPTQPARITKPVETISIHTVPVIKERDNEMKPAKTLSKSDFIRIAIRTNPGIRHDELVAKYTNNSADKAILDKANALIEYVTRQGGFNKLIDSNQVKRYYTHAEYLKHKDAPEQSKENKTDNLVKEKETKTHVVKLSDVPVEVIVKPVINDLEATHLAGKYEQSALSVQEGGDHYKRMKIQPIEYITANNLSFIEGSVVKYISRWKNKNGVQDLKKARHFIDILIEQQSAV